MKTKIFSLIIMLVISSSALLAHPPSKPTISYDKNTGDLTIFIGHPVKDAAAHYVSKIEVFVNGKEISVKDYASQSSLEGEKIVINLPGLKSGSKVKVSATCNIFGKSKGSFKIE